MTSELGEDDKRVGRGWKVGRESDVRLRRVGDMGWGNRARQDFARGRSRWCDGAMAQGHGIATSEVNMGITVKFSEALPCVKSPVSRTAGTIYVVT